MIFIKQFATCFWGFYPKNRQKSYFLCFSVKNKCLFNILCKIREKQMFFCAGQAKSVDGRLSMR